MKVAVTAVLVLLVGVVISLGAGTAVAARPVDIPEALEPWREWVLHDSPERACPTEFDNGSIRRCWWPSRLSIAASDQGGLFDMQVMVYAPTWVSLPGSDAHWPESVTSGKNVIKGHAPAAGSRGESLLTIGSVGDYCHERARWVLAGNFPLGTAVIELNGVIDRHASTRFGCYSTIT